MEAAAKAIESGQVAIFGVLVQSGLNINSTFVFEGNKGWTLLHVACKENSHAFIEQLLKLGASTEGSDIVIDSPVQLLPEKKPAFTKREMSEFREKFQCELFEKIAKKKSKCRERINQAPV